MTDDSDTWRGLFVIYDSAHRRGEDLEVGKCSGKDYLSRSKREICTLRLYGQEVSRKGLKVKQLKSALEKWQWGKRLHLVRAFASLEQPPRKEVILL